MDRLSTLLTHFGMNAGTFHSGELCGTSNFEASQQHGHLHLLRSGRVTLRLDSGEQQLISVPSLIFFPRPHSHRLIPDAAQAPELVCATLNFSGGVGNPLSAALPDHVVIALTSIPTLGSTVEWLFAEAFHDHCGRNAVMDRLFELLVIQLLRHFLSEPVSSGQRIGSGMLAGLADLRLAKALNLMHAQPEKTWTVADLADAASMSRASFAAHFRDVVGQTPADYLLGWRVSLAQKRLREGRAIALIADEVGYESPSALARAFRRKTGSSPREWLGALEG
jgi:AraC-like DNA-binding protein